MKIVSLIITFLMSSAIASQERQSTQAERVVLDTPEVITLKLAPITRRVSAGVHQALNGPFDPDTKIRFALVAANTSLIPLVVRTWDYRAQNRPRLLRDNQEVPYREGLSELLTHKDSEIGDIISIRAVNLEPNIEKRLEYIDLIDWYEPLKPGHYQLSTQHRFIQGGKWVDSASITFEVKPKDSKPQQR
jgi:hypothetical protein